MSDTKEFNLFATEELPPDLFDICKKPKQRRTVEDYQKGWTDVPDEVRNFVFSFIDRWMLLSPAFLSLSPVATKLYLCCINNTKFPQKYKRSRRPTKRRAGSSRITTMNKPMLTDPFMCPYRMVEAFGVSKNRQQIADAFNELRALKFITQIGVSRSDKASVYQHCYDYIDLTVEDVKQIKNDLGKAKADRNNKKKK